MQRTTAAARARTKTHSPKAPGVKAQRLAAAVVLLALALLAGGIPAANASQAQKTAGQSPATSQSALGNDVSWPQCGKALPKGQDFAIVGVNGGLANNTNPCLAEQLQWAAGSPGTAAQPKVSLYVNTANPGTSGSWWPSSNEYPAGSPVSNPYGTCATRNGTADVGPACAYMYGYAKAYDDAYTRGISNPGTYMWWLDVETGNSWSSTDKTANRAALEGMTDFFHSLGSTVGLYSTGSQWSSIVGTVSSSSSLYPLASWLAGARTSSGATANCTNAPLTAGGKVTLTQFVSKGTDYDHSCA